MKRGLLWVALLLSAGFNLGVLASLVRDRQAAPSEPAGELAEAVAAPAGESVETARPEVASPMAADAGEVAAAPPGSAVPQPAEPGIGSTPAPSEAADAKPAAPSPAVGAMGQQPESPPIVDRLQLAGEARLEFVRLQQQLAAKVRAMQPRIARAQADLYRELSAPDPDRQRIEQRITFIGRASAELERAFADTALRSRELLDPEQEQIYLRVLSRRIRMLRAGGDGPRPPAARRDGGPRPPGARPRLP